MPRAQNPKILQRRKSISKAIKVLRVEAGAKILGIDNSINIRNFIEAINLAYNEYLINDKILVSPGSRKRAITPLVKKTENLLNDFSKLDEHSLEFLIKCGIKNTDIENLQNLHHILTNSVAVLDNAPKKIKPENYAKRIFTQRLQEIFITHHPDGPTCNTQIGTKQQLVNFMVEIFEEAQISYPDPITNPDRFDDFLKNTPAI